MSHYAIEIKPQAQEDLKVLSQSEPKAYQKSPRFFLSYVTIFLFFYCCRLLFLHVYGGFVGDATIVNSCTLKTQRFIFCIKNNSKRCPISIR